MLLPLLSSLMLLSAAPATPDLSFLTTRLQENAARMAQLDRTLTKSCTDRAENLDGDGKPEKVFVESTRTEWVRGIEAKAILSATEDGQDVTAREQEKLAAEQDAPSDAVRDRGNYGGIDFSNPFSAKGQKLYRFTLLPSQPSDGARLRIGFEPKGEKTSTLNKGVALVEPDGALVSITAEPSDYPSFVHFVHFHATYARSAYGPVQTDFSVDGAGGFLFVQKHYREHIHCSGFSAQSLTQR